MKLAKENLIYILSGVPGILGLLLQVIFSKKLHTIAQYILIALLVIILIQWIRHFLYMPAYMKNRQVGDCVHKFKVKQTHDEISVHLLPDEVEDVDNGVTIQNISPLLYSPKQCTCVLGKTFYKSLQTSSTTAIEDIEILASREYLSRKHNTRALSFFTIVFPILLIINFVIAFYNFNLVLFGQLNNLFRMALMPTLFLVFVFILVQIWEKIQLRLEEKTDSYLCGLYPIERVIKVLSKIEQEERSGEKESTRMIQNQDFEQRKDAMKKLKIQNLETKE